MRVKFLEDLAVGQPAEHRPMKAPVTLKTERLVNAKQVVDGQALVMVSRRTPSAGAA